MTQKKFNQIKKEILREIKPSQKDTSIMNQKAASLIKVINKHIHHTKSILGGSGAKDTWLKGNYDADIYVQFNFKKYKDQSNEISKILEKALKKSFKIEKFHGSRDYFQIKNKQFTFEIIPILELSKVKDARNITDVSPFHARYIKKNKRFNDDMRLLITLIKEAAF